MPVTTRCGRKAKPGTTGSMDTEADKKSEDISKSAETGAASDLAMENAKLKESMEEMRKLLETLTAKEDPAAAAANQFLNL